MGTCNALSLGTWVVSWLNAFTTDAHCTDALVLSFESNDDDNFAQLSRPRHNCHLLACYLSGNLISTDSSCASHFPPLIC